MKIFPYSSVVVNTPNTQHSQASTTAKFVLDSPPVGDDPAPFAPANADTLELSTEALALFSQIEPTQQIVSDSPPVGDDPGGG